jgi:hypothetical protein
MAIMYDSALDFAVRLQFVREDRILVDLLCLSPFSETLWSLCFVSIDTWKDLAKLRGEQ